jgi:hypothetical protein
MANKWLKQLTAYEDSVNYEYDSFAPENCLYTPSPYWNWIFANKSGGMPKNSSILLFSEPKAGKSLGIYSIVDELHRRDKDAIAIIFNTELRGALQHNVFPSIDKDRMIIYDTNDPVEIFDRVEKDIKPMVQDMLEERAKNGGKGFYIALIAIDSLTNIQGIKRGDADSVAQHLMGDRALTIQIGLSKLIPFCKRNKIFHIGTEQMRANMDGGYGGPKEKMAASWATKHSYEYYISFKRANSADDKIDIEGNTFEDEDVKDARGNHLLNGHKVYVKMEQSSVGQAGRAGIITFSYDKGITNQHEEIFWLGKNTNVITMEGNKTYIFGEQRFNGKKECALAIRDNPKMASAIVAAVKKLDSDK